MLDQDCKIPPRGAGGGVLLGTPTHTEASAHSQKEGFSSIAEGGQHSSRFVCFFFFVFLPFLWAAPAAYVGSQARGQIGAVAAGLHHSHSNAGSLTH